MEGLKLNWNKIEIVQKMQDYIKENVLKEEFSLEKMYSKIGYSKRHCERIFKELIKKTPSEYVKLIMISNSSQELIKTDNKIIDIAFHSKFNTHEGYTRAFKNTFSLSPKEYRTNPKPIPLFVQYSIKSQYLCMLKWEELVMNKETVLCMTTVVERPRRKLIFLRSTKATDYFSYCEEVGCDWEGLFNSIPSKMESAAILELPKNLMKEGCSNIASGVEVPIDYKGKIPENCEVVELEPCKMLYFESEPFEKEEDFFQACESVIKATQKYQINKYGYEYDDEIAPRFNFGGDTTAKYAIPIKNLK